jgi:hypothetical protein
MIKRKRALVGIGAILGAIVLGAVGSGVWERGVGPLFDWLTKLIVSGMSRVSHTYMDSIYREASKGFHEFFSLQLYCLYLAILPVLYLILLHRHPHGKKAEHEDKIRSFLRSKKGYYMLNALTCAVLISMVFGLTKYHYINSVCTVSKQSISVLAPHVSDLELKRLWARFHSMTSQDDFMAFKSALKQHAETADVNIPAFPGLW